MTVVECPYCAPDEPCAECLGVTAAAWDESRHPRHPRGSERGGEFSPSHVAAALHSWIGFPTNMRIHMANELAGEPEPDNAGGRIMREQARALLREVTENGRPNDVRLYRGAQTLDSPVPVPQSWSEHRRVANRWGGEGRTVFVLEPGGARGIRVRDYVSAGMDQAEEQWLLDPESYPDSLTSAAWDESRHSRHPRGSERGGEFAERYSVNVVYGGDYLDSGNGTLQKGDGANVSFQARGRDGELVGTLWAEIPASESDPLWIWQMWVVPEHRNGEAFRSLIRAARREFPGRELAGFHSDTRNELRGAAWDESRHPRHPRGSELGGEFRPTVALVNHGARGGHVKLPGAYLRFGDLPVDESASPIPSLNNLTGERELGTSVYAVWHDPRTGLYVVPGGSEQTVAGQGEIMGQERVAYLVSGRDTGDSGDDGEPLLSPRSVQVEAEIPYSKIVSESDPWLTWEGEELEGDEIPVWPSEDDRLRASAWDESKHPRHPAGSELGGEFAPKSGSVHVNTTKAREEFDRWAASMEQWYSEKEGFPPDYWPRNRDELWERYEESLRRSLPQLRGRLAQAGVEGVVVEPQLSTDDGGDLDAILDPDRTHAADFNVEMPADGNGYPPGFTVWTHEDGSIEVVDVLDIGDDAFFPSGPESDTAAGYVRLVDAARGQGPGDDRMVTIYRGMSDAETDAWESGEEIPAGKWFTDTPTTGYALDVDRAPPVLQSFSVPRSMLIEASPGEFQLKRPGKMRSGRIEPVLRAAGEPMGVAVFNAAVDEERQALAAFEPALTRQYRDALRGVGRAMAAEFERRNHALAAAGYVEEQHPRDPGGEHGGWWVKRGLEPPGLSIDRLDPALKGVWHQDAELVFESDHPGLLETRGPGRRAEVMWKASRHTPTGEWKLWIPNNWGNPHHDVVEREVGWHWNATGRYSGAGPSARDEVTGEPLNPELQALLDRHARELRQAKELAEAHEAMTAAATWSPPTVEELLAAATAIRETEVGAAARKRAFEKMVDGILRRLGISFDARSIISQAILNTLGLRANGMVDGIRTPVARIIANAYLNGLSVPETAAAIREGVDGLADWQATQLARNDLVGMANGGSLLAARIVKERFPQVGLTYKEWLATDDERTRPSHNEAHGQVAELATPFVVGAGLLAYPGDPSGPDGEVINCRCTVIYRDTPVVASAEYADDVGLRDDVEQARAAGALTAAFDETKIKRYPKGTKVAGPAGGGRFAPKNPVTQYGGGSAEIEKGDKAREILGEHPDTQSLHTNSAGRYVPERLALHDEIIGSFLAPGKVAENPVTVFMAGGSGAGKSTVLRELDDVPADVVLINPDEIKEMLPEYGEMVAAGDLYAARGVHEESSDIAKKLLETVNERGYDAIVDGTGDSGQGKFLSKVEAAGLGGRHAKVVLVDIPTDVAVVRAKARAVRTGRMVPEDVIREIHASVAARHAEWADVVDDWEVWSNDDKPRRIAYRKGGVTTIVDRKRYAQALAKGKGVTAAAWDESKHPRHPSGSEAGGEFALAGTHYYGARLARDENDRGVGYVAFKMTRGERRGMGVREDVGPVRETYQEAADDARAVADAENAPAESETVELKRSNNPRPDVKLRRGEAIVMRGRSYPTSVTDDGYRIVPELNNSRPTATTVEGYNVYGPDGELVGGSRKVRGTKVGSAQDVIANDRESRAQAAFVPEPTVQTGDVLHRDELGYEVRHSGPRSVTIHGPEGQFIGRSMTVDYAKHHIEDAKKLRRSRA